MSIETTSRYCIITSKLSTKYPCTLVFNCVLKQQVGIASSHCTLQGKKRKSLTFILSIETTSRFCIIKSKLSTNYPCILVFNCLKGVSYFNSCVLQQGVACVL